MLNRKIKEKILRENNLEKALEILSPYKDKKWGKEIVTHLQNITPDDDNQIADFSYQRKNNE